MPVVEALALDQLEIVEGSFVDPEFVHKHTDRLYSVPLASGSGQVFVYILFEHQSSDEPLMVFRLLAYMVRIWEQYLREHQSARELPAIIPLLLYHEREGWQSPRSLYELFPSELTAHRAWAELIPSFRFLLDDVSVATDQELQSRQMTAFARLALWLLRDARFDRLDDTFAAWTQLFVQLLRSPDGQQAIQTLFCYIFEVRGSATVQTLAEKIPDPSLREAAMTIAQQLRQEGREEGREEGLQRLRHVALKLLMLKFGGLDQPARARIETADADTLERYTERVLSASTLDEVLQD